MPETTTIEYVTLVLAALAALGGLVVFWNAIRRWWNRPRFSFTFDDGEKKTTIPAGVLGVLRVRIASHGRGPATAEQLTVYLPDSFQVMAIKSGDLMFSTTPQRSVAGPKANTVSFVIGGPVWFVPGGDNAQLDLSVIPPERAGDHTIGINVWPNREAVISGTLKVVVRA
ncbi:MAG: hypothetical protein WA761_02680 [Thermoplasmata archaeon]